ncbi:hypothetical protein [Mameliella sediminis]|uniref:hypothetical protein n=1 Tax=Mameliella sediminis TaxID=2836866 RepID=UPI001C4803FE|nr:hypothetical protein [Mameliella sediminis]MBV7393252.1 hypothetical protein [Mameliella sediminis]
MAQIAVGILSKEPEYDLSDTEVDPLREWAIAALQSPGAVIPLTEEAADRLRQKGLPVAGWMKDVWGSPSTRVFSTVEECQNYFKGDKGLLFGLMTELGSDFDLDEHCKERVRVYQSLQSMIQSFADPNGSP